MSHIPSQCCEVRLYGLHPSVKLSPLIRFCMRTGLGNHTPHTTARAVTTASLDAFFSAGVRVLGVLIHPTITTGSEARPWAQIWTASEEEVQKCLTLKDTLAEKDMMICRAPNHLMQWLAPEVNPANVPFTLPLTPPHLERALNALPFRPDTAPPTRNVNSLARNLYILGVPIDMTQHQFKALFVIYGMVEHSTLLSQLDGAGRRRGFVLMSTHHEAATAMSAMNGQIIDGYGIDISWALVQREAKHFHTFGAFPNRGIHPPAIPARRDPPPENTVLVENLDPNFFPNAGAIREIFSHFGPVVRVTIIPGGSLTALLAFEHKICADALVGSNGMNLGGRPIFTKSIAPNIQHVLPPSKTTSPQRDSSSPMLMVSSSPLITPPTSTRPSIAPLKPVPSPVTVFDPFKDEPQPMVKLNPESQAFIPYDGASQDQSSSSSRSSRLCWCQSSHTDDLKMMADPARSELYTHPALALNDVSDP